jgi:hypothetical protein
MRHLPNYQKNRRTHISTRSCGILRHHRTLHNLTAAMLLFVNRLRSVAAHHAPLDTPTSRILARTMGHSDQCSGCDVLTVGFLLGMLATTSEFSTFDITLDADGHTDTRHG